VRDAIPADLQALLEPIASTSVVDSGVEQRLVGAEGEVVTMVLNIDIGDGADALAQNQYIEALEGPTG